jgi:SAM-dependent methyltransferase
MDYVNVTYNQQDKPFTDYPGKLVQYLYTRYNGTPGCRLLDVGCGRGEYAVGFKRLGVKADTLDKSEVCIGYYPELKENHITCDIEKDTIPPVAFYDLLLLKSTIEHLRQPFEVVRRLKSVLKPGGKIIITTPDWTHCYKSFYGDYTHYSPFTINSIRELLLVAGFVDVESEQFLQVPVLWKHPWLKPVAKIMARLTPPFISKRNRFLFFSGAKMILASGKKPPYKAKV